MAPLVVFRCVLCQTRLSAQLDSVPPQQHMQIKSTQADLRGSGR